MQRRAFQQPERRQGWVGLYRRHAVLARMFADRHPSIGNWQSVKTAEEKIAAACRFSQHGVLPIQPTRLGARPALHPCTVRQIR